MDYPDLKVIGERIRTARFLLKLTLKEFAGKTGIGYASLSRIESGKKVINIKQLIKICQITDKPLTYYLQEGNSKLDFYFPPSYRKS